MMMLFHSNKINPVFRIHVVFNKLETEYISQPRFLGINIREN
jgi:hypothetical protein